MTILILGVVLWSAVHLFPAYAPDQRAKLVSRFGEGPYKIAFSLATILTIVVIVQGWTASEPVQLWAPPVWLTHVNNLLILIAFIVFFAGAAGSNLRRRIRHPQLTGVKIWGVAHLLVNGDLRSVILFGGLTIWAGLAVALINRRDGPRTTPPSSPRSRDLLTVGVGVAAYVVVGLVHPWLFGAWPFPG